MDHTPLAFDSVTFSWLLLLMMKYLAPFSMESVKSLLLWSKSSTVLSASSAASAVPSSANEDRDVNEDKDRDRDNEPENEWENDPLSDRDRDFDRDWDRDWERDRENVLPAALKCSDPFSWASSSAVVSSMVVSSNKLASSCASIDSSTGSRFTTAVAGCDARASSFFSEEVLPLGFSSEVEAGSGAGVSVEDAEDFFTFEALEDLASLDFRFLSLAEDFLLLDSDAGVEADSLFFLVRFEEDFTGGGVLAVWPFSPATAVAPILATTGSSPVVVDMTATGLLLSGDFKDSVFASVLTSASFDAVCSVDADFVEAADADLVVFDFDDFFVPLADFLVLADLDGRFSAAGSASASTGSAFSILTTAVGSVAS